ncbi:MAG: hypothetical protein JWO95_3220 [Verrucomicrobiales bacterium]|nr:hypothetical protein [Verrucomicrobiales bacterium]
MLVRFPEIVLGSHAFFYRDAGLFGYPVGSYIKNSLWHGEIPLWNPYSNCGIPFLAQWNTMVLYPGSLLYIAFPMPWSMNAFLLAHMFLAAVGMYKLAHRLFGSRFGATFAGLVFAWNGLSLQCIMWPCNLAALAWMPWVILLCERAWKKGDRAIVWAALVGACQMLTGSPEFILLTWLIVLGWFAAASWRRKRWCWMDALVLFGCAMLVAILSAAQLLPTFDLIKHGDRSSSFDTSTWSLPVWGVANFFVPLFRSTPSVAGVWTADQQQWTSSYYTGLVTLLLAATAIFKARQLKTLLLAGVAIAGIVFAMGDSAVVLKLVKAALPILGFIRYPIKYIALTIFALPLLAAAGAAYLQTRVDARISLKVAFGICIVVLAILANVFIGPVKYRADVCINGSLRLVSLIVGIGLLIFASKTLQPSTKIVCLFASLLAVGTDISFHVPSQNPTVITAAYEPRPPQMKTFPKLGESRAMVSLAVETLMGSSAHPYPLNMYMGQRHDLFKNCNLLDCGTTNATDYTCIPKVNGFYSLHLREQAAVATLLYSEPLPVTLAQFVGVSQVTSYERLFTWDAFDNAMPMATIGQQPIFADESTTLEVLRNFKPRDTVILPTDLKAAVSATRDTSARVQSQIVRTHEHLYDVEATRRTMLVVAQTYFHNWKAFVDGKAVPILRANEAFQAIEIPEGKHLVRFVYRDKMFYAGVAISGAGLLACAIILWLLRNQPRHSDSK